MYLSDLRHRRGSQDGSKKGKGFPCDVICPIQKKKCYRLLIMANALGSRRSVQKKKNLLALV